MLVKIYGYIWILGLAATGILYLKRKLYSDCRSRLWISDFRRNLYGNNFGASVLGNASFDTIIDHRN